MPAFHHESRLSAVVFELICEPKFPSIRQFCHHISTPFTGSMGPGNCVSPNCCRRSISMIRHSEVMGVSLARPSNGFFNSAPNRSVIMKTYMIISRTRLRLSKPQDHQYAGTCGDQINAKFTCALNGRFTFSARLHP